VALVTRLDLRHFRNLTFSFSPADGFNFLVGANGSGKTGVLESLYLLSRGRSFRTSQYQNLIEQGRDQAMVQAHCQTHAQAGEIKATLSRLGGKVFHINLNKAQTSLQMMHFLPLVFIDPHNVNIVLAEPQSRRAFIDGLLFHVEQQYFFCYKEYLRCLRQRNRMLQLASHSLLADWNEALAQRAEEMEKQRQSLMTNLLNEVEEILLGFDIAELREIEFSYWKGWQGTLREVLERDLASDQERGWTSSGCHRADIKIILRRMPAARRLSLGQQRMVALAFFCAAHRLLMTRLRTTILFMLDDIVASLDHKNLARLMSYLAKQPSQVFVTATDKAIFGNWTKENAQVFHMERLGDGLDS